MTHGEREASLRISSSDLIREASFACHAEGGSFVIPFAIPALDCCLFPILRRC